MKFALASAVLAAFTRGIFTPAVAEQGKATAAGPSAEPEASQLRKKSAHTLRSEEGLEYRILVSAPNLPPPPGGFPTIYVQDGNEWFDVATQ
jgi:hypothetical protein